MYGGQGADKEENKDDVNKFELLGRTLESLQVVTINYPDGYKEVIPKCVFLLT